MGTKLLISNPNLSFLQWITAIHFPGATGPAPPIQTKVYVIVGAIGLNFVSFDGVDYPYGAVNDDAVLGTFPPITPLVRSLNLGVPPFTPGFLYSGGGGANSPALNGFVSVMQYDVEEDDIPFTYVGGFYTSLAVANEIVALPLNSGFSVQETTFTGPLP
jgi:hypothetical protein